VRDLTWQEDCRTSIVLSTVEEGLAHQVSGQFSCFQSRLFPVMVGGVGGGRGWCIVIVDISVGGVICWLILGGCEGVG